MDRLLTTRILDALARMGCGGGVRGMPMKLAGLYASNAKECDDYFILDDYPDEGLDWKDLIEKIRGLELPAGVRRDVLPRCHSSYLDEIGFHKRVLALGVHPTAFSEDGRLCRLMRHSLLKPLDKGHVRTSDLVVLERWRQGSNVQAIHLEQAIILDEQRGHFGHWLFEQLPQLRLLQGFKNVHIIYNGMDNWKRRLLIDFGWPEDRLVPYFGGEVFEVGKLWTTSGGNLNFRDLNWLRSTAFACYGKVADSPRRLYVSRQRLGSRMVSNFDEILPVLEEFDIHVIQPELLGIEGAVQLFRRAEFIIGPEGSGIRNMVWSEQARVVEIFGHELNFGQWSMAFALGFDYLPYMEAREVPVTKHRWRYFNGGNFCIDPSQFRRFLANNLGE